MTAKKEQTKAQHTPGLEAGPFEVRSHPKVLTVKSTLALHHKATNGTLALLVMGHGQTRKVGALLEAAPDLLEALTTLVDWVNIHVHGGGNTSAARKDYQGDVQKARAAIAKARGES